ncbi:MAG TPA: ribulokinase, partial [Verrucomicrobiae bacterium]|nr:ribulokinase [Verrucomicrobiae bacterium]
TLIDSVQGRLGGAVADCAICRPPGDPDHASQRHEDQMKALAQAMKQAMAEARVDGKEICAIGIATTGSTVVPVDKTLQPIDDYYLWCDHRAKGEAEEITGAARQENLEAIDWCGGVYSPEMAWAKILHWLRRNPEKRARLGTFLDNCDMAVATLAGVTDSSKVARGVCAAGHKWLWNSKWGGFPSAEFLAKVDPLLAGMREKVNGREITSEKAAGALSPKWAQELGLTPGIPIAPGMIDAHADAVAAGISIGDLVNVIGTSTCVMAVVERGVPIPGITSVAQGSIHPGLVGIEAGLSAAGDIFEAIARRAGKSVEELSRGLDSFRAGQTGLLRLSWDNGDRNVLSTPHVSGITFGWSLRHEARDELFAAIEGTAFHTKLIFERLVEYGVPIRRVIHGGGIPRKNPMLNRVYAGVFKKPVLVPDRPVTGLGSAIFAFLAAGTFKTMEQAQEALCPGYETVQPRAEDSAIYDQLFRIYRELYFAFGKPDSGPVAVGSILPRLKELRAGGED